MFKRFVVSGTKKDNILTGTEDLDVLWGNKGNDVLSGGEGDDFLFGDKGNDQLFGENGNDKLFGGKGKDELFGGEGDDKLFGGKGKDELSGGEGDDKLFGGKGDDQLFGGEGDDKLFGGKGNDFLDGGAGSDYLFGDKGNDTFNFTLSENDSAKDIYDGGKGRDTLQLTLTTAQLGLESVQKDIANFEAFLASKVNSHGDDGRLFHFYSFDLTVRNIEKLEIVEVGGGNVAPVAVDDTLGMLTPSITPIRVAVVGHSQSSYLLAAQQLNPATLEGTAVLEPAIFAATPILYTTDRNWSDLNRDNYDVVVLGDSGNFDYHGEVDVIGEEGALFTALNSFVSTGGGVVTTGLFAFALSNNTLSAVRSLADSITPIAPGWAPFDLDTGGFNARIDVSNSDHEIVHNLEWPTVAMDHYFSNANLHEFAPNLDAGVTQLGTGTSVDGREVTAIAYNDADMSGGRTVYLGGTYFGNFGGVRDGVSDQVFENAIAWAAGARGGATITINPADLLANDEPADSRENFTFESFTPPGADGASLALLSDGNLVYTLGLKSLLDLRDGLGVTDSFQYTMGDGDGGFDTASVTLSIDSLL